MNDDERRDKKMIPATVQKILEKQGMKKAQTYMTLDEVADVDPDSYKECKVNVPGLTGRYDVTMTPQQAYDLARMNRILHDTEDYAVTREEFQNISARLAGCPKELTRESVGGRRSPSATARLAEYLIVRDEP